MQTEILKSRRDYMGELEGWRAKQRESRSDRHFEKSPVDRGLDRDRLGGKYKTQFGFWYSMVRGDE